MPFLLAEILNFQGSAHLTGVGSLSNIFEGGLYNGRYIKSTGNRIEWFEG